MKLRLLSCTLTCGSDGVAVPTHTFEMQTGCNEIFKVVIYTLEAGKTYTLQLAFAKEPGVARSLLELGHTHEDVAANHRPPRTE